MCLTNARTDRSIQADGATTTDTTCTPRNHTLHKYTTEVKCIIGYGPNKQQASTNRIPYADEHTIKNVGSMIGGTTNDKAHVQINDR